MKAIVYKLIMRKYLYSYTDLDNLRRFIRNCFKAKNCLHAKSEIMDCVLYYSARYYANPYRAVLYIMEADKSLWHDGEWVNLLSVICDEDPIDAVVYRWIFNRCRKELKGLIGVEDNVI